MYEERSFEISVKAAKHKDEVKIAML